MTGRQILQARSSDFDRDPELLNTHNGFVNLRTGQFIPHTESHGMRFRHSVSCPYDPVAKSTRWLKFLNEAHPDDAARPESEQIIPYLQYLAGTAALGYIPPFRNGFWIFGVSTTGKSKFSNVLRRVLGNYAILLPKELLIQSRSESRMACSLVDIRGKRLVCLDEVPGGQLNDSLYKMLTSADGITARGLYQSATEFQPTHTLLTTTNCKPTIDDIGGAVFKRLCPIPFQTLVVDDDPDLEEKLMAEASGILNWIIEGATRVLNEPGLYREPPELVRQCREQYRQDMDIVANFVRDCCEACDSHTVTATTSLFGVFGLWSKSINQFTKMTRRSFLAKMEEAGYHQKQYGSGSRGDRMLGIAKLRVNEEYQRLFRNDHKGKEVDTRTAEG